MKNAEVGGGVWLDHNCRIFGQTSTVPRMVFGLKSSNISFEDSPLTSDGAELPCLVVLDVEPGVLHDLREGNLARAVALVRRRPRRRKRRDQTQH